jgi:cobalt-zinc-cadmium efflux system protein
MNQHHTHKHDGIRNIKIAFFLNLGFTVLEIIGGLWTNSLAILSDALHDLGDSLSLGLSWFLEGYSKKEKDKSYSYGYTRFSLLSALTNGVILLVGSLIILAEAVPRIMHPEPANAKGMLIFAIFGVLVNGYAVFRLQGGKTLNIRTVTWHLIEDVLGWLAVLIVSVVLLFKEIHTLDPILAILITLYVLYNVFRNVKETMMIFLQAVPGNLDITDIERKLAAISQVKSTHHTHLWSMDGERHVLTTHIVVDDQTSADEILQIKKEVKTLIHDYDIQHITVEIEHEKDECIMKAYTDDDI